MKVLMIEGFKIQDKNFMYNRLKQYILKGINVDVYEPNITRSIFNYIKKENDIININGFNNKDQIIFKPKILDIPKTNYSAYNLCNIIKNNNYDLITAHYVFPYGYCAYLLSLKFNIPYIVTAHGNDIHTNPVNVKRVREATIKTLNYASKVIFVSEALKESAVSLGYNTNNSIIINNGIDEKIFKIGNNEQFNKEWSKKKKILYAGNLQRVKGADFLIDIFERVRNLYDNVEMFIIGNGEVENELRKHILLKKLQNDIHLLNWVSQEELSTYMNIADVLIVPSREEGWSCVVNEALACGTPVVGTKTGGIPEAICGDSYGSIVSYDCNKLDEFLNDFAKEVVKWLQAKYDKQQLRNKALKYTWDKICEMEVQVMKNSLL